jgi:uncharacterized membrane protein (UPF0127 family)
MRTRQDEAETREYVVTNLTLGSTVAEHVYVAGTSSARRKGLRGVARLGEGVGLWIAPCEAIHTFGMKIPIDAIFIDSQFFIRKLRAHMRPRRISACLSAVSVLELEAGSVARTGASVGHRLHFEASQSAEVRSPRRR